MNVQELKELVSGGKSERVEFKRSTGQQVGADTLEDIAAELRKIEPPAFPDIETISIKKGAAVIVLTVSDGGGAVAVAMYDDHLEIKNPGDLHFGITPEKLTKPHESKPWN